MYQNITGYCPTLEENYTIRVNYLEISAGKFHGFTKDTFQCRHNIYGDSCSINDCPIYMSAPDTLQ